MSERYERPKEAEPCLRDWTLEYHAYEPKTEGGREVVCSQGNGYLAVRASSFESNVVGTDYPGTYRAGLYNQLTTDVEGKSVPHESLVRLPDWTRLEIRLGDGPSWRLSDVELLSFRQCVDLEDGSFTREYRARDQAGRVLCVRDRRIASMASPHVVMFQLELRSENWSGTVTLREAFELEPRNYNAATYRALRGDHLADVRVEQPAGHADLTLVTSRTRQSHVAIAQAIRTVYSDTPDSQIEETPTIWSRVTKHALRPGHPLALERTCAIFTSSDPGIPDPQAAAITEALGVPRFERIAERQRADWHALWSEFAIEVAGDPELNGGIRLCLYHLLQTVTAHSAEIDAGTPARGWSGEGYHGHVFWDEVFLIPVLALRSPALARGMLTYRTRRLDAAKQAAAASGYRGAMFPWRSASRGYDVTDPYRQNPVSHHFIPDHTWLQRHVGSAIAYSVWQYYSMTGDDEYLAEHGAELILEVGRFWASIAQYNPARSRFDIRGVVGPDEFHERYPGSTVPGIDNNAYTNVFAAWVLATCENVLDAVTPARRAALVRSLDISDADLDTMRRVSRELYVPFVSPDVLEQFEGYSMLREFDLEAYAKCHPDIRRMDDLLNAEGDDVNNYQISKQADVLMLFYLFCQTELTAVFERLGYAVSDAMLRKNLDYYGPRTVNGSTLSRVVDAWVSARVERGRSLRLARKALLTDVCRFNASSTTTEGIHLGAIAGATDIFQRCYFGLSAHSGQLWFEPDLPSELERISMNLRYRGTSLRAAVSAGVLELTAGADAASCEVRVNGEPVRLRARQTVRVPLP